MPFMRILVLILLIGLGVAAYLNRDRLTDAVQNFSNVASALSSPAPSAREKEVRAVFDYWSGLFTQGDPKSESVYAPNVVFRLSYLDNNGNRVEKQSNAAEHLARSQKFLPHLKAGRFKVRFENIQPREQPDGKVRVDFLSYLNEGTA